MFHEGPRLIPYSDIPLKDREVLETSIGIPYAVIDGENFFGVEEIGYRHGAFVFAAILKGNEIQGVGLEHHAQPGVVAVAMRENKLRGLEFCTIGETRTFTTGEKFITINFVQGHTKTTQPKTAGRIESTGESINEAGRRELREEAGIETDDPGEKIGVALRDVSLSPDKVTFILYMIPYNESGATEQELDPQENIMPFTLQWRTLDDLLRLRRTGEIIEIRTLAAISLLEDFLSNNPKYRQYYLDAVTHGMSPRELKNLARRREKDKQR
ncbi:MAG: NUDIX domain-containing protein [Candidatus Levybacteria bacterium]|nr:NUDIX domain-containing protein [Candidatus Levybacteria bacterium]